MSITTTNHSNAAAATSIHRIAVAIGASVFGALLVYFAGFSPIEAVHNAAHDTRHSSAFPCH
ncbi:cobalt transporter [Pseudomonas agarici]|uniref:Cobalt transporter n=1 Tax=Pseudomonas agarici TaxID=46677 RepID=A0A0X1SZC6_PSEAA|nr:CbtB-domain containing protein [Pseudomonas agarici]AMB84899.1 cobalt transporter [Pseudomonas agarici]NWB93137.1 CbtB-domain containing protein [Pseudomonas agarici]NWC08490.1 CbtB-domain containing protein [Pseudomonas agarici]SEK68655.1 cobalt transporter subunit CbtB [Pseudomonas agarici]